MLASYLDWASVYSHARFFNHQVIYLRTMNLTDKNFFYL